MDRLNDGGLLASHEWLEDRTDAGQDPHTLKLQLKDRIVHALTGSEKCFTLETAQALAIDFFCPEAQFTLTPPHVIAETEFGRLRAFWFKIVAEDQEKKQPV